MMADRDTTFCSCCTSSGVRYRFVVLTAEKPALTTQLVRRLSEIDQAMILAKLRRAHY